MHRIHTVQGTETAYNIWNCRHLCTVCAMQRIQALPSLGLSNHCIRAAALLQCGCSRTCSSLKFSTVSANKAKGGLPRFHVDHLPSGKDMIVRLEGDEFWHMSKVLRLGAHDRLELFDGMGGLVEGLVLRTDRSGADIVAVENPMRLFQTETHWHVFSAFGTLKGGRADWLIEKCTELGASSITPLITARSNMISENRVDRWQRVIQAAIKQCQRLHQLTLNPPTKFEALLPQIKTTGLAFLATAESKPFMQALSIAERKDNGILIVGPEGDFTEEEIRDLTEAGAAPVGLGPRRLRVETATVAMLAAAVLWTDCQHENDKTGMKFE